MAKHRHSIPVALSPAELRTRIGRASREGRFQQALELAKQLHKAESAPETRQLLLDTYLGRARQLRSQRMTKDAIGVLEYALQLGGGTPAWLREVAQELSLCGKGQEALAVAGNLGGDPQLEAMIRGQTADAAIQQEAKGRPQVPAEWQGDFDRVLQAFALIEAGQDEQAREALQPIGLRSPFLEWKVFLRGLIAFYQGDDARALENWQRLVAERLPDRLAAPYRLTIDAAYRQAQSAPTQATLQKIADQLLGGGLVPQLRSAQKALADENKFSQAFRQVDSILPALRQTHPEAVPRLATCLYWAMIADGGPEDLPRYQRLFGAPRDDPKFDRLRALVLEHFEPADAHKAWQEFEKSIAANPASWPGEQAQRARALIWLRMARNAAVKEDLEKELASRSSPYGGRPRMRPHHPPASECFQRSLELGPDLLDAHRELFRFHLEHDRPGKAEQAAEKLLRSFPEHMETLVQLGGLLHHREKYAEAVGVYERALRINPLDRRLRMALADSHVFAARTYAEAGTFERARASYGAALALYDESEAKSAVYCKWAACEFKAADEARAEEKLRQALATGTPQAVYFSMLIEVIRLKLPHALKKRFDLEFKKAIAEPPTAMAAAALAEIVAMHQRAGITYLGQKTHERHVLTYLGRARQSEFSEEQLEKLCDALSTMNAKRVFQQYIRMAQRRFPQNPFFMLCEAQALSQLPWHSRNVWEVRRLLEAALVRLRKLPADERQKAMIKKIDEQVRELDEHDPFSRAAAGIGGFFGGFGPDSDDDWDHEDEWET